MRNNALLLCSIFYFMKKERQKILQKWLRSQQKVVKKYLYLNVLFGPFSAVFVIAQMWLLATLLHKMIIEHQSPSLFLMEISLLFGCFCARALLIWLRERVGFKAGQVLRIHLRSQLIHKLLSVGPISIQQKPARSWATIKLEQEEK